MMNFIDKPRKEYVLLMLEILNLSDGKLDLLDICNIKGFKLINYIDLYEKLIKSKHIKIKK